MPHAALKPSARSVIAYAAAYLVLDALAALDPLAPLAPWMPAPVLALAAAFCAGPPGLAVMAGMPLAVGLLWHGGMWWSGAPLALLQTVVFGAAGLALRRVEMRGRLGRLRDVVALIMAAATAAVIVTITHAVALAAGGDTPPQVVEALVGLFFQQAATGVAVLPVLLILCRRGLRPWRWPPSWETLLQMVILGILSWEIFGRFVNQEIRFFYLMFLPFAWIAARHGVAGTAAALAAVQAALLLSHHVLVHEPAASLELQVRMLALGVISLLLAAVVSERRSAEKQLAAHQAELAHVLRLNIGWEMASGLAHELNQPLTAAMSYNAAGLRLLRAAGGDQAKVEAAFAKATDQIERASAIIRRLRDFMRKGEISVGAASLPEIIEDAVRLAGSEMSGDGIALRTLLPPHLPPVLADKIQIAQVLVNLVRNAAQAIAGSGAGEGEVRVAARLDGDMVEVTVSDTGPGVPATVAPRLFEPFVTSKASGMGLGLSISKSIIEAHGGRLWLDPHEAGGAVFHFTLPVAETME